MKPDDICNDESATGYRRSSSDISLIAPQGAKSLLVISRVPWYNRITVPPLFHYDFITKRKIKMTVQKVLRFDDSRLSADYASKGSMARYKELTRAFPNTLIVFVHDAYYYGFDKTAVALALLFNCRFYRNKGMLVIKIESGDYQRKTKAGQLRGFRCIVDNNGILTFQMGKKFSLEKPMSYYEKKQNSVSENKSSHSWIDSASRHGRGWHDDAWSPGLPSSRFFRNKSKG